MKVPSFLQINRTKPKRKKTAIVRPQKMRASTRSPSRSAMDDYEDEPTMKLGTAVIVVLVLHIVAVGGVYAFNRIKAERIRTADTSFEVVNNAPTTVAAVSRDSVNRSLNRGVHQVESGETLANIARSYDVPLASLEKANGLSENSILRIGQELRIPKESESAPARSKEVGTAPAPTSAPQTASSSSGPKESGEFYTVVAGDNPVAIARHFNVSYNDLMKLNDIDDPRRLQIGQKLRIPIKH